MMHFYISADYLRKAEPCTELRVGRNLLTMIGTRSKGVTWKSMEQIKKSRTWMI